ncbi:RnfH family protein [Caballeronia sp. DA-9]|uniref:RnfH family protein n=1 Tax=Caballeronia sp. DA-9 TaxID=3436237 RepID=UPI003F66858D
MTLSIEVCYALPDGEGAVRALSLAEGATVQQAIDASGLLAMFPEIDLGMQKVGVFGKIQPLDAMLADHDRVEIYRPLKVDPKVARQRRVEKTRRGGSIEGRRWTRKEAR